MARQDARRLDAMVGYCKTTDCLRGYILDYFGQEHDDTCGSCGNCRGMFALEDVTVPAQMILSCVRRISDALGYDLGAGLVIQVLRGSRSQRVRELGLDRLSTYGLMKNVPRERVQTILDFLESKGYLRTHPVHRSVRLTGQAREVLFDGVRVELPVRLTASAHRKEKEKPTPPACAGSHRPLRGSQSPAHPAGPEGAGPGLHHLHQRHPGGHGRQAPPDHGGDGGGQRRGPEEAGTVRRSIFAGHCRLRKSLRKEVSQIF